jgi:WD40 repeat protein
MKRTAAALLASLLVLGACARDGGEDPGPISDRPTPDRIVLPTDNVIFFLGGTNLYMTNTGTEKTKLLKDINTTDVSIAPDGKTYAYTEEGQKPITIVSEVGAKVSIEIPGRSPSFSPDGKYLATSVLDPNYLICDPGVDKTKASERSKGCQAAGRVMVYETKDLQAEPKLVIGAGLWDIVGWSAGNVVAYNAEEGVLSFGDPSTKKTAARVSLIGATGLSVAPGKLQVLATQGQILYTGYPNEPLHPVDVGAPVDATAFSPDGTRALLAVVDGTARTLSMLDTDNGAVTSVPGSEDLVGPPIWSTDGNTFAFVVGKGKSLQAKLCDIEFDCNDLFQADGGIDLLYLDN